MANYYYSGQGSLYEADRDGSGNPTGFRPLGNVPSLEMSIEVSKFEHKESESGSRAIDLTIVQEKKGTFSMTVDNLAMTNLAMAFWGTESAVTGASITDEEVTLYHDKWMPLAHPAVSALVVGDDATPTTTYVLGTDYEVNLAAGSIKALSTGDITDGQVVFADYTHASYSNMDGLTQTSMEKYLRFEGLNTIDGKTVVVDIFKASIDPLTGFGLINEENGSFDLTGNILYDSNNLPGGFFRQRYVT
jgi:hypothetical protein